MRRDRIALIISAAGAVFPALGFAQTANWTFNGGGSSWTNSWQINSNWNPNTGFPNSASAQATFPAAAIAGGSGTVLIGGGGVTVSRINFVGTGTNNNGYTIGGSANLTIANNGTIDVSSVGSTNLGIATIASGFAMPPSGTMTKTGNGVLVLSGPTSFSGVTALSVNGGVMRFINSSALVGVSIIATANDGQIELQNSIATGSLTIAGLGSIVPNPNGMVYSSGGNNTWNGNWFINKPVVQTVSVVSGTTLAQNGTIFDANAGGLSKGGSGTFVAGLLSLSGTLSVNAGTVQLKQNVGTLTSSIGGIQIVGGIAAPTGRLDVSNHRLAVVNGDVATIKSYIQDGYDSGAWDGNGISSFIAQADAAANGGTTNLAVGYARGDQLSTFSGGTATFGSASFTANDVVVMLTVVGDTNLDGVVDVNKDFANFMNGYTAPHSFQSNTDWFNGDFNYDGSVDLNKDFTAYVKGFVSQGGSLNSLDNAIDGSSLPPDDKQILHTIVVSVPEPSMAAMAMMALGMLFPLNRKRR